MSDSEQMSLFATDDAPTQPPLRHPQTMRVMVTVTAAPNPSTTHGETVCVAGLRIDLGQERWVRLYPVNLRHFGEGARLFRKYDVVETHAAPQTKSDQRLESWAPRLDRLKVIGAVRGWEKRLGHLRPQIVDDMCGMIDAARADPRAPSLGLVRPADVLGLHVERHPGWTPEEQAKIEAYVGQLDLFGEDRTPLEAPRFKAWYRYRCHNRRCRDGHRQGLLDWEFVAHQRHLSDRSDDEAVAAIRTRWLDEICGASNDVAFYVGNQAKRRHVFSVLGVVYPSKRLNLI